MNIRLLKARQTRYWTFATIYILVVLTIAVIANVLADRYNKSYDATANKRYSLSPQTAKIVKELKQDATISYFDTPRRDDPKPFDRARDLLGQYANLSSKIRVEYLDAVKDPQLARAAGVTTLPTTLVQVGNKKEQATGFTEESITGAFIRDLKNNIRTVCFASGSGEHQIDDNERDGYSRLKTLLGKDEYAAKSVDLLQMAAAPDDCTVLVVGGPTKDYRPPEVDAVKRYVEGGGRALFMFDPPFKFGRIETADNDPLMGLLQGWGVTVDKDLILDLNPIGQLSGLGAQVALVTGYNSHPILNEMKGTATGFPLSRSIQIKSTDKTSVEKLFDSSRSSLATANLSSPQVKADDPKNKKGPLTLAAAGTYNTGKANTQGRFVVVGSSRWVSNSFINVLDGNADLALNTVNWLASDEDLISIRPKDQDDRRITLTRAQFNFIRITSQFLLPLAVVIAGVSVWWKRR